MIGNPESTIVSECFMTYGLAMAWGVLLLALSGIGALGILALSATAEETDWRLDLLKLEGIASETSALLQWTKKLDVSSDHLDRAIGRLGSEDHATREQAQREIVLMGKKVLPLLARLPESAEPEVRQRVLAIQEILQPGCRWAREDLVRHAVTSLLRERLNNGNPAPAVIVFAEFFDHPLASLKDGYKRFHYKANEGMTGSVHDGVLVMNGNHVNDGDQRLLLDAKSLYGKKTFPDKFRIEARLGGEVGGEGAYHIGLSIGNVRALFHPGFDTGGFRFQRVDTQEHITQNTAMEFDPQSGRKQRMSLTVQRLNGGRVELVAMVSQGDKSFTDRTIVVESVIGKLDHISLDRSGREGGNALFDDLVVELGNPAG
jgi:hypothetical protein